MTTSDRDRPPRRLSKMICADDFRIAARRRLPRMVFDYIDGGAGSEATLRENRAAIEAVRLLPSAPADVAACDQSVNLFGTTCSMPVIIGPTGAASASWPRGEIAFAKVARAHGILYVLSNSTSIAPEEVANAGGANMWFQLYLPSDREIARQWVERVRRAGFTGLQVTVDVAVPGYRHRDIKNGFVLPFTWTAGKFLDVARRPGWALSMLRYGTPVPYLQVEAARDAGRASTQSEARRHRFTRSLSWDAMKMLRDEWSGPLVVKGIMDPDQATKAVETGIDGIVISNHGGRQLDGAVSPMEMLPEIRAAVGQRLVLLIDGGFQSGVDIVKALALGADAVQMGRAPVFALATAGADGVDRFLTLLRAELDSAMALCGVTSLEQLDPSRLRGLTNQ